MAEGLLGGMLGDEEEKPAVEPRDPLAAPEAFAAAVASIGSRQDPEVARETAEFLRHQSQLLRVQKKHLEDEHALRLLNLKGQIREGGLRRGGIRIRIAFQLFAATIAALLGAGAIILVHDAFTSHRVVIEPFHAPPALAARGIDGAVVAGGLLDELTHLQNATRSSSAALGLSGAWTGNIKLDVPETGISINEISRLLRERFGNDVHIDGDLIEAASGGLALTVRGQGVAPKTFVGPASELESLTIKGAEYVYSQSQPARFAAYLSGVGRNQEAIEFCRTTVAGVNVETRAELLNDWANALENTGGSQREALLLYRAAVKLKPDLWRSHSNLMNTFMLLGEEEQAWRAGEVMRIAAGGRPGRASELMYQNSDLLTWNLQGWLDSATADATANAGVGTQVASAGLGIADAQMRLHDPNSAELALKTTKEDPRDPTVAALTHFVRGRLAADAGKATQAATEMDAFEAAWADPIVADNYPGYQCWIAPVMEAAGRPARADALLASAGTFVDCYRFRGDILDGRGDWAGAQKVYAEAVAIAPDLPAAYYSWGVALARHGDLPAAEAKLKDAHLRGPHWADPLKAWGDVLSKRGNSKEALAKYDEALKYAPNWAELKEARESVVNHGTNQSVVKRQ